MISDYIKIHHIGDDWIPDRKTLEHKVISNHKWATKINHKISKTQVFNPYPSYDHMLEPLRDIIKGFYPDTQKFQTWFLVQNSESDASYWHDHCNEYSPVYKDYPAFLLGSQKPPSISSVFYMTMPENCGGISFKIDEEVLTLYPKLGDLVFFPSWLVHKPLSNTHLNDPSQWRISININLFLSKDL
tara:strand:- start:750 stop:1310 length:561 start_codon:yes stop_codon:yes gene_type:complete